MYNTLHVLGLSSAAFVRKVNRGTPSLFGISCLSLDPIIVEIEHYSQEFERHKTILHTPKGNLFAAYLKGLKNQPGLQETYFLKTNKDIEKFLSLPLPKICGDVSSFSKIKERIGNRGIVYCGLGLNPGGYVVNLFGSEQFAIATIEEREMIHLLLKRRTKIMQNLRELRTLQFLLSIAIFLG